MKCELIGQEHRGSGGGDVSGNLRRVRNESKSSKKNDDDVLIIIGGREKNGSICFFLATETGFKVQMITGTLKKNNKTKHKLNAVALS